MFLRKIKKDFPLYFRELNYLSSYDFLNVTCCGVIDCPAVNKVRKTMNYYPPETEWKRKA